MIKFDLAHLNITIIPEVSGPCIRKLSSITLYNETLLLFGGLRLTHLNDLWAFDVNSEVWSELQTVGQKPSARKGSLIAVVFENMFVYGGNDASTVFDDWYLLNLQSLKWKSIFDAVVHEEFTRSRHRTTFCQIRNQVFVFGGLDNQNRCLASFDLFSFDDSMNLKVTKLPTLPQARFSGSLCQIKEGILILFGGLDLEKSLNDVWLFNIHENMWNEFQGCNKIPARSGHCCVTYGEKLLVIGGSNKRIYSTPSISYISLASSKPNHHSIQPETLEIHPMNIKSMYCFKEGAKAIQNRIKKVQSEEEGIIKFINLKDEEVFKINSQFPDDFSAIIYICRLCTSYSIQIQLKGTLSFLSEKVCKIVPKKSVKKITNKRRSSNDSGYQARQNMLKSWERVQCKDLNILKISIKPKSSNENFIEVCINKQPSCLSPLFRFSKLVLVIHKLPEKFSIILIEWKNCKFLYFRCELGLDLKFINPGPNMASAVLANIISRTHLKSSQEILSTNFIDLFLYTDRLKRTETGDIFDENNRSFVNFMDIIEDLHMVINKILCKKVILNKQPIKNFCGFKVFSSVDLQFSVLMYHCSKPVYWEYQKPLSTHCSIIDILDYAFINPITGLILPEKSKEIIALLSNIIN